jgi:hypothetical protein
VAQLGARLDGIEEAVGSNPIGSTKSSCKITSWLQKGFAQREGRTFDTCCAPALTAAGLPCHLRPASTH